jgi:hypothetical protein
LLMNLFFATVGAAGALLPLCIGTAAVRRGERLTKRRRYSLRTHSLMSAHYSLTDSLTQYSAAYSLSSNPVIV